MKESQQSRYLSSAAAAAAAATTYEDGELPAQPQPQSSSCSNVDAHVINGSQHMIRDPGIYSDAAGSGNVAKYKLLSPAKLPISRPTACITIPPGLSPTSFLESPVLLSNIKAEPSPTTGSLSKLQLMQGSVNSTAFSFSSSCTHGNMLNEKSSSKFEFNPKAFPSCAPRLVSAGSVGTNQQRSESFFQAQGQCQFQSFAPSPLNNSEMAVSSKELNLSAPANVFPSGTSVHAVVDSDESNQRVHPNTMVQAPDDRKDSGPPVMVERSSDDGYNWRKYGQKVVKGSEFPRSYYKCTHPNCEVKKIFERSHDGQITEIVYKGTHDHPKPQLSRRYAAGAGGSVQEEKSDKVLCLTGQEDKSNAETSPNFEANFPAELFPRPANDDSAEGTVSQFNSVNDEIDEDDPFSKRRKMDSGSFDVTPVVKPIREPRVVVQTVSEVDILDDGYRWRKYGQKVVRGNPNPRSYYKCTNAGCPVRKHVERASHDPKAVITTYEGKHNHNVPTAKTSGHDMTGPTMVSGMPRTRIEENDRISLDLGVGMSYGAENRNNELLQTPDSLPLQNQGHISGSNFKDVKALPISAYYGAVNGNGNLYGSRESYVEGHSMETTTLSYTSNPYPPSLGRVLLGP